MMLFTWINALQAKDIEVMETLAQSGVLSGATDLHLQSASCPIQAGCTIDLQSDDAWLFFDEMKPSLVLENYANAILINGQLLIPSVNARVSIYKHGTVIIPHSADYASLETYTERNYVGEKCSYNKNYYYTNTPVSYIPEDQALPLLQDDKIQSLKLKRGYMVTLANEPDGSGYSRVFIADKEDLVLAELPHELAGKVSFIRVLKWEWTTKKGWAGSVDKNQNEETK